MKRKTNYLILSLLFMILAIVGQLGLQAQAFNECGTEVTQGQHEFMNFTRSALKSNTDCEDPVFDDDRPTVRAIPLKIHILRDSNGNGGLTFIELQQYIEDCNRIYLPYGIWFYYVPSEIDYIDDSDFFNNEVRYSRYNNYNPMIHDDPFNEYELCYDRIVDDMVDVFFVQETTNGSWASFPSYIELYDMDWIVIKEEHSLHPSALAHELGHYFNLYHTFQGPSSGIGVTAYEDPNDPCSCGPGIGDELCDTPADPLLTYCRGVPQYLVCVDYWDDECNFDPSVLDNTNTWPHGEMYFMPPSGYDIYDYNPDMHNIMSYSDFDCMNRFSPGQIERMNEAFNVSRTYIDYNSQYCGIGSIADPPNGTTVYDGASYRSYQNTITTSADVEPDAVVYLNGGESVKLISGFNAKYGSHFKAFNENCADGLGRGVKDKPEVIKKWEAHVAQQKKATQLETETIEYTNTLRLSNYPNPFVETTTISYYLEDANNVSLTVYDITGREVSRLIDEVNEQAGMHNVKFDGNNLEEGIYFYTLKTGENQETKKMLLAR